MDRKEGTERYADEDTDTLHYRYRMKRSVQLGETGSDSEDMSERIQWCNRLIQTLL